MLQTLKKFFNFCGEDNRKLFTAAIWQIGRAHV